MPPAILFDFDGVLADSLPAMRSIYDTFLISHGIIPSDAEFESLNGPSLSEIVSFLKNKHSLQPSEAELFSYYSELRASAYATHIKPCPQAVQVVQKLAADGYTSALVTASERKSVQGFMHRWGIARYFKVFICGEDVIRAKPAPDIYRFALKCVGTVPEDAVAIEDSLNGVQAAAAADIRVIAVSSNPEQEALIQAGACKVVPSLAGIIPWLEAR